MLEERGGSSQTTFSVFAGRQTGFLLDEASRSDSSGTEAGEQSSSRPRVRGGTASVKQPRVTWSSLT